MTRTALTALLLLTAAGCNGDAEKEDAAPEIDPTCDPLDPSLCALPFPSSLFLTEDDGTSSGYRVAYLDETLPINRDDSRSAPTYFNEKDGFSTMSSLLFYMEGFSLDGHVRHMDLSAYEGADVKTVLIDVATGERVPHWVELDDTAEDDDERLTVVHPAVPLKHETTYVFGIRGAQDTSGNSVVVSEAFAALRDSDGAENYVTDERQAHFDDVVFPALEGQGFERGELQLAWDFRTLSVDSSLGRMEWMRDDALDFFGDSGPAYEVTEIEDADCAVEGTTIGRTIYGDMTVPLYTETDEPGTILTRDDDGMPFRNGTTTAPFMVRLPCSLILAPEPGFILQYGHGLLGDMSEARTGYLSEMADRYKWVIGAASWKGMSEDDVGDITLMLVTDITDFIMIPERSMQGFVEKVALGELLNGDFATDDAVTYDGVHLLDAGRFSYYGNSQGGILGGAYLALSKRLERGVLGVPGMPYGVLLTRSADFDPFFLLFKEKFKDHRDITLSIALMQQLWDPAEGSGWAWQMNQEPREGVPAKDVLLQAGIGDAQVTTLGAQIMARAYGATTVSPQTRPVFGVDEREAPFTGSALVEWYYPDGAVEPVEAMPPDHDGDTHECPRRERAAQDQLRDFVEEGVINQYCDGVCEGIREGFCD